MATPLQMGAMISYTDKFCTHEIYYSMTTAISLAQRLYRVKTVLVTQISNKLQLIPQVALRICSRVKIQNEQQAFTLTIHFLSTSPNKQGSFGNWSKFHNRSFSAPPPPPQRWHANHLLNLYHQPHLLPLLVISFVILTVGLNWSQNLESRRSHTNENYTIKT